MSEKIWPKICFSVGVMVEGASLSTRFDASESARGKSNGMLLSLSRDLLARPLGLEWLARSKAPTKVGVLDARRSVLVWYRKGRSVEAIAAAPIAGK
jgi:hypothetical protein